MENRDIRGFSSFARLQFVVCSLRMDPGWMGGAIADVR